MVKSDARLLDLIFQALSDSTRRSILRDVARKEKSVSEIAKPYRMSLAAVSKHLKVLGAAGLIAFRKQGSYHLVSLNPASLKTAEQWLAHYQQFWDDRLDALKNLLEEGKP